MKRPRIKYVWNRDVALAYRVFAQDPNDLLCLGRNVEVAWESTGCSTLGD